MNSSMADSTWIPILLLASQAGFLVQFVVADNTHGRDERLRFGLVDFYVFLFALVPSFLIASLVVQQFQGRLSLAWRFVVPMYLVLCQAAGAYLACVGTYNEFVPVRTPRQRIFVFTLFGLALSFAGPIVALSLVLLFYLAPLWIPAVAVYVLWVYWRRRKES